MGAKCKMFTKIYKELEAEGGVTFHWNRMVSI